MSAVYFAHLDFTTFYPKCWSFHLNTHPEFTPQLNDQTLLFLAALLSLSPTREAWRQETPHHLRHLYWHHYHHIWKQVMLHHEGHLLLVLGKSLQNKPCGSERKFFKEYFAKKWQLCVSYIIHSPSYIQTHMLIFPLECSMQIIWTTFTFMAFIYIY